MKNKSENKKLFWKASLLLVCVIGITKISYAIACESLSIDLKDKKVASITEKNKKNQPNIEIIEPASRNIEQMKKEESLYLPPSTTREVPFQPTMDREDYLKAKKASENTLRRDTSEKTPKE